MGVGRSPVKISAASWKRAAEAAALRDMNMPEIDWFLERFAPAFGLTLDGLQGR